MTLKEQIRQDLTTAMKARDTETTSVLRMAMAAIANAEVAGKVAKELNDEEVLRVIQKEVSSRKDSAEAYTQGNRLELAEKELAEAKLLQKYLPQPLTEAEVDQIVAAAVAKAAADQPVSMKLMGQVMKTVNAQIQGRADGSLVAAKVKAALVGK